MSTRARVRSGETLKRAAALRAAEREVVETSIVRWRASEAVSEVSDADRLEDAMGDYGIADHQWSMAVAALIALRDGGGEEERDD